MTIGLSDALGASNTSDRKLKAVVALVLALLATSLAIFPVFATDYNPGVSVGDYVTFGNWGGSVGTGTKYAIAYEKIEVVSISGKEVDWRMTGQMKTGSEMMDNGSIYFTNVETGATNYTHSVLGAVIAANLNQGDKVPIQSGSLGVNSTEIRTYLGISRMVNIVIDVVSSVQSGAPIVVNSTFVYDRTSGILLETDNIINTIPLNVTARQVVSGIVSAANLFSSSPPTPPVSTETIYLATTVAVIVPISAATVVLRRRRNSEKKIELVKTKEADLVYNSAGVNRGECYLSDSLERCMKVACDLHSHGVRGLAIVREDPEFLTKNCHLEPENVLLLSIKPIKGFKAISTVQEVSIALMKFVKADGGVVLLDGLEYLISRFGFSPVYMMLQEKKIEFLEAGAVLLVTLNTESLNSQEKGQLLGELKPL